MKALALLDGTADVFLAIKEHRQTNMTPITRSTAWIYGSVSLPLAIISYPLAVWIPRLYSTEIGIDLGLIGLVIFCAAIFDAISDPAMGFMSDRFQTRWGRRKPWIAIGSIVGSRHNERRSHPKV